jgi:hypothetical protein
MPRRTEQDPPTTPAEKFVRGIVTRDGMIAGPLDERIKEAFNAGVEWAKTEGAKRTPVEDDADGEEIVMDENGPVKN